MERNPEVPSSTRDEALLFVFEGDTAHVPQEGVALVGKGRGALDLNEPFHSFGDLPTLSPSL